MEKKVFRSRVSVLILLFVIATISFPMIFIICSENILNPTLYTLVGTLIFCFAIIFGMNYTITEGRLLIKILGIKYGRVEISEIISVERSYNPLSSPASSLKRLCIRFKKSGKIKWPFWLISPAHEQEFLDMLKEINPDIHIRVVNKEARWRIWDWDI